MARINRGNLICLAECRTYHVTSRCTRRLHLFGGTDRERSERKHILLRELERVATYTAVGVAGFALMGIAGAWPRNRCWLAALKTEYPRPGINKRVSSPFRALDEYIP